jgi:hypothetical protein
MAQIWPRLLPSALFSIHYSGIVLLVDAIQFGVLKSSPLISNISKWNELLLHVITYTTRDLQLETMHTGVHVPSVASLLYHFLDQTITEYICFQCPSHQLWIGLCYIFIEYLNFCSCSKNVSSSGSRSILPISNGENTTRTAAVDMHSLQKLYGL